VAALAWWLDADGTQIALLILAIGLVVTSEIINTSVEVLAAAPTSDAPERSPPPTRIAKDLGAAAVVVAAGVAAAVGIIILGPLLLDRIGVTETAWIRAVTVASVVAAGAVGAAWRWVLRT
jgi:undecaprenol kinase/diacylglycerol kinase (ATP)